MPIRTICPGCGANVSVPDEFAGQHPPVAAPSGDPWSTVRVGLAAAQAGAVLGAISAICLAAAICVAGAAGLYGDPEADLKHLREAPTHLRYGFPFCIVLGVASAIAACTVTLTGWSVCLAGAERSLKARIGGAVAAFSVVVVSTLLLVSYMHTPMPLKYMWKSGLCESPHSEKWTELFLDAAVGAVVIAYALYAGFLRDIAHRTDDRSLSVQTGWYTISVIALVPLVLISGFAACALLPILKEVLWGLLPYYVVAFLVLLVFHFLWLRSLTAQARRALRRTSWLLFFCPRCGVLSSEHSASPLLQDPT
jgi:hypothetical protein